jgi:hypothetical protein
MLADLKPIFSKVLVILIIVVVYFTITKYSNIELFEEISEPFENTINNEKTNYLKLKETYIKPNTKTLDILYSNHVNNEENEENEENEDNENKLSTWKNKTLDQCIDKCNNLDKCIGFSRDNVLDTEPADCHPRINSSQCYSNRKGDYKQMSNAIKYNTYIKSETPNSINNCIGDIDLTLNRVIFLKTYSMPNKYIGYNNDARVQIIEKDTKNFKIKCSFRIEAGKEGSGTVSFLHIDTNKYLCRDKNNDLIFKELNKNSTENKQRCSFNINDGLTNGIILKSLPIEGEVVDKYITLNNNYLKIISKNNKMELLTFYIVDTINNTTIITNKNKINNSKDNKISNNKMNTNINEAFTLNLDNNETLPLYNNLFNENNNNNINIDNYLEDNYLNKNIKNEILQSTKKLNNNLINKKLTTSKNKNKNEYNIIKELNKEIENEISNKNVNINKKNTDISNNLNKMRIKDLANDYFFLKSISK